MFIYVTIVFFGFFLLIIPINRGANVFGWWLVLLLIFVSSVRLGVGVDYENYHRIFYEFSENDVVPRFEPISMLIFTIGKFFKFHFNAVLFVFAFITLSGVFYFLGKVRRQYGLSIYIFITVPIFYLQTFNHLRQWLAIGVLYAGFAFLCDGRKLRGFLVGFISILAHYSMVLPALLGWFFRKRISGFRMIFYSIVLLIGSFLFFEMLEATRYGVYLKFDQISLSAFYFLFGISCVVMVFLSGYFSDSVIFSEIEILCLNLTLFSGMFLMTCYLMDAGRVISMRVNEVFVLSYIPSAIITLERFFGRENIIVRLFVSLLCSLLFMYTVIFEGKSYQLLPFDIIGFQ